jgi:glycine/D-amino acid oxidase-like deaminating enzyme
MSPQRADVAIVGAGILGLPHAYLAAKAGKSVVVAEIVAYSSEQELRSAGAHYTAETVAHTLPLLDEIQGRIGRGERP